MNLSNYLAKTNPDKSLQEHTEDTLSELECLYKLKYINKDIYTLTQKALQYHDYGKANKAFQNRIKSHTKFNDRQEIAHNILSMYFIKQSDFDNKQDYYRVAEVVLNHHAYVDTGRVIEEKHELIQKLLKEFSLEIQEIGMRGLNKIKSMKNDDTAILMKGYLHRCDYSASAGVQVEYPNDFLLNKLEEWISGEHKKKSVLTGTPIAWNPLQIFCRKHEDENLIITAQTGMGKTEAGLLWMGNYKGFFILPIRTAINAIYDRIRENILKKEKETERVALLHSENLAYYARKVEEVSPFEYRLRSRQLSIPITVSTLDQLFDFVFKYSGFEMKLTTLSYSKIVIDEIQMYGPELLAYLIYGISMIIKYGGKVAILTATLPPFVKDLLIQKGFAGDVKEASFTNEMTRHSLKVCEEPLNSDYIIKKYRENQSNKKGNKILVVCNTVKNAQQVYKELEQEIAADELHILHNKLIKMDRAERERKIQSFASTKEETILEVQNGIWIATSIVEASLDLDFDYLFTELSDINGLFQRLGRCNRKGLKPVVENNCYVFTEISKNLLIRGDRGFIDRRIYELSKNALKDVDGVITEEEKIHLIDTYFTTEALEKSDYMRTFTSTWEYIEGLNIDEVDKSDVRLRNIFSETIIPGSIYWENEEAITLSVNQYENQDISLEERLYHKEEIMKYTMSVESYIVNSRNSKAAKIENILNLKGMERIYIIDCDYSKIGFEMKANDGVNMW